MSTQPGLIRQPLLKQYHFAFYLHEDNLNMQIGTHGWYSLKVAILNFYYQCLCICVYMKWMSRCFCFQFFRNKCEQERNITIGSRQ